MDWHKRYLQQASWTRELRRYLMEKAGIDRAARLLEVGCGTGAILLDTAPSAAGSRALPFALHGLDISASALSECASHAPEAHLTRADALALPYASAIFDITFSHFLLLWVHDPGQALDEMRRVTRRGGHVIAMAEPDYSERVDQPEALSVLGMLQARALQQQGANTSIGSHLAELVRRVGLQMVEAGSMAQWYAPALTDLDVKGEWEVLRADLNGMLPEPELDRLMRLDAEARRQGQRVLHVPTYFALAQV
jgi:ubiquinone/menaquinone biosynthesis C-methylase UbiE